MIITLSLVYLYLIQGLPKAFVALLREKFTITSSVVKRDDAKDQSTTKLLIQLQDGKRVEACVS